MQLGESISVLFSVSATSLPIRCFTSRFARVIEAATFAEVLVLIGSFSFPQLPYPS